MALNCYPFFIPEDKKKQLQEQTTALQQKLDSHKSLLMSMKNWREECERELGQSRKQLERVPVQASNADCFSCFDTPPSREKKMQMRLKQMQTEIAASKSEKELLEREMEALIKVLNAEEGNASDAKKVEQMSVKMPFGASTSSIRSKTPAEQRAMKEKIQGLLQSLKATSNDIVEVQAKKLQVEKKGRQATIAELEKRAEERNDNAHKIRQECSQPGFLPSGRGQTPTVERQLKTQIQEASHQLNAELESFNKTAKKSFAFKQS